MRDPSACFASLGMTPCWSDMKLAASRDVGESPGIAAASRGSVGEAVCFPVCCRGSWQLPLQFLLRRIQRLNSADAISPTARVECNMKLMELLPPTETM